jgi:hypothetical protein
LFSCGGPQSQSAECKKWIQCEASFAPNSAGIDNAHFGEGEACWADKDSADACTAECKRQLATAKTNQEPAAACQ